ncbi:MAG TPA: PAS domain-containing protein, partial [Nitrosopumilaceae archaeon]|nr:PAS domain-containing protein [Nitrosopumilaceae archaeon]
MENALRNIKSINDIYVMKDLNEALLSSEENFRLLFNSTQIPQWIYDLDSLRILYVNEAATIHYGYSEE